MDLEFAKIAGSKSGSTRCMTSISNHQSAPNCEKDPIKKPQEGEQEGPSDGAQGLGEEGSWRDGECTPDQGADLERPDDVMVWYCFSMLLMMMLLLLLFCVCVCLYV